MSNIKKLMMTAAGGEALNVEDVFSVDLYRGTGSANHTITTGVDILGEGGVTWLKSRTNAEGHNIYYNDSGTSRYVKSTDNSGSVTPSDFSSTYGLQSWTNTGFKVGVNFAGENGSGTDYVGWSFRKAPKFFDVVFYTGDGTTSKTVSHDLGTTPGAVFFKRVDASDNWTVWHRSISGGGYSYPYQRLNGSYGISSLGDYGNNLTPTSSVLRTPVHSNSGNTADSVNVSGASYVALVFAHNNNDGEFGPTGDKDIIKCGSYTGNGNSSTGTSVNLGFEPQWVFVKNISSSGNWELYDVMRGMSFVDFGDVVSKYLRADQTAAENGTVQFYPTGSGFTVLGSNSNSNSSGHTFIYIAIRRGDMGPPENADEVFAISTQNEVTVNTAQNKYGYYAGFPVDMAWKNINTGEGGINTARIMQGKQLRLNTNAVHASDTYALFDDPNSYYNQTSTATNRYSWMFRRAAGFFDVAAWKGSSASSQALNHSLGVAPEMIWAKNRKDTDGWIIYHKDMGNGGGMTFQSLSGYLTSSAYWNNTTPSASTFTVGNTLNWSSSFMYIGYLFATLNGVSKVGSYTGNGSSQTIDCGFSSGASFVLVKRYDTSGNWTYWDSKRGIVAGNDTSAKINGNDGFVSDFDDIDPTNSGFIINQNSDTNFNVSSGTYIFYAIAAI